MKKNNVFLLGRSHFDIAIQIVFFILLFLGAVIFDRSLGIVFSLTKITFIRIFFALILSLWAIKLLLFKDRFIRNFFDWPIWAYLLSVTIATITAVHVLVSFVGFYGRYEGLSTLWIYGLLAFIAVHYLKNVMDIRRLAALVGVASLIMSVYSIIQRHHMDPYAWGGVITWQRVIATIGQPNFFAAYVLMSFFLLFFLFIFPHSSTKKEEKLFEQLSVFSYLVLSLVVFLVMIYTLDTNAPLLWYSSFAFMTLCALLFAFNFEKINYWGLKVIFGILLFLNYIALLYTQSRGGYMGFFVALGLLLVLGPRRVLLKSWREISILMLAIFGFSLFVMLNPEFSPVERFSGEVKIKKVEQKIEEKKPDEKTKKAKVDLSGAAGSRAETWKSGFRIIIDYPLFGIGPEDLKMVFPRYETDLFRFKEGFHVKQDRCHNSIFDEAVTRGLVSLAIYVWLLFLVFYMGIRKLLHFEDEKRLLMTVALCGIMAYFIQNQFSFGVVAIGSLYWVLIGVVGRLCLGDEIAEKKEKGIELKDLPWAYITGILIVLILVIYISCLQFRADVHFKNGKVLMDMGKWEECISELEKSLSITPWEGGTVTHYGIALLNYSRVSGQAAFLDKSIQVFLTGAKVDAYNADNFQILGKIYLFKVNLREPQSLEKCTDYINKTLAIDPYYAEAYLYRGDLDLFLGKRNEAVKNYTRAFMINPSFREPQDKLMGLLLQAGGQKQLLGIYEKAYEKYPGEMETIEYLGNIYMRYGYYEKALNLFSRLKEEFTLDDERIVGYIKTAEVLIAQGKLKEAFLELQEALMIKPDRPDIFVGLGDLYLKQGNRLKANEMFAQVLRLDPNNLRAKQVLGR